MLLWDTFFAAGKGQLDKGVYPKAEELLKSALGETESFPPGDPRLLKTLIVLARVYQESGRPGQASSHLDRADDLVAVSPDLDPEIKADLVQAQLSQLDLTEGDEEQRIACHKRLVSVWGEAGPERQQELTDALFTLAGVQEAAGLDADARNSLRHCLELREEAFGGNSLEVGEVVQALAESLFRSQSTDEAERQARRVISIYEKNHGEASPELAQPLAFLARILERQQRFDEALELVGEAASLPGEQRARYTLEYVSAQLRAGRYQEALGKLGSMQRAEVPEELLGEFERGLLRAHRGLGALGALCEQAERMAIAPDLPSEARVEALVELAEVGMDSHDPRLHEYLEQILELAEDSVHEDGDLLKRIAELAAKHGLEEKAEQYYDRAISALGDSVDTGDPASTLVLYELGALQERRRLLPEAASSWERSLESLKRHSGKIDSPPKERILRTKLVQRLARIYVRQRRWERAEQAWRSLVRSSQYGSKEHVRGRLGLAEVYTEQKSFRRALDYMDGEDRIVVDEKENGRRLYDKAFLLRLVNLTKLGQSQQAKEMLDQRFEARGDVSGVSIQELAAAVYFARLEDDELFAMVCEELESRTSEHAEEQLLIARFYELLAKHNTKLLGSKDLPLGLTPLGALRKAVEWALKANGQLDLTVADLTEKKAQAAVNEGEWSEAEESTRRTLELRRILQGERSPALLSSLQRLGDLQLGRGQLEESVESLDQALKLADQHLAPDDTQLRELLRSLVEAYRRLGDFERAKDYLDHLLSLYERFNLRAKDKLDDLMRGIRLLLGDGEYREQLGEYLDEATELADSQGEVASLSLAFCLGQKARLLTESDPDRAITMLRRQGATLGGRDEASEFLADQLLLCHLLLFRGQPRAMLKLLSELRTRHEKRRRSEHVRQETILEARALFMLRKFAEVGRRLEKLDDILAGDERAGSEFRAEVCAVTLDLYAEARELVGDEAAAQAYAELDRLVSQGDWSGFKARHKLRNRWNWELSRLRFETDKLSPQAALSRLSDHVGDVEKSEQRTPEGLADTLALLGFLEEEQKLDEQATLHLRQAQSILERAGETESLQRAQLVAALGRLYERGQQHERATEAYQEAVAELKSHLGGREPLLVPLHLGLARLARREMEFEKAESWLREALTIVDEEPRSLTLEQVSQVLVDLAELLRDQERHQDSVELWNRVRHLWEQREDLLPTIWLQPYLEVHRQAGLEGEALQFFLDGLPFRLGKGYDSVLLTLYAQWLERELESYSPALSRERIEMLDNFRDMLAEVLEPDPTPAESRLWARILVAFARLHLKGLFDVSLSIEEDLDNALKLREAYEGVDSPEVGEVLCLRARWFREQGNLDGAEAELTRALNISENTSGPETWDAAQILLQLAQVYFAKQKFSPTEAVLQRTLELCRELLEEDDARWIPVCQLQGQLALELARPVEAYDSLMKALELSRHEGEVDNATLLVAAGRACLLTMREEAALKLFMRAERTFPEDHNSWNQEMEDVVLSIGELCLKQERYEEANERLLRVMELQEERFGFGDAALVRVYRALGIAATGLAETDTAEERLEVALALQEEDLFEPLDLFEPFVALITIYLESEREERACELLKEHLERCREAARPQRVAELTRMLAHSFERRGDLASAESYWRENLASLESALEKCAPPEQRGLRVQILEPVKALAELCSMNRRYTEAEELTKRRLKTLEMTDPDEDEVSEVLFDLAELYRLQEMYSESGEIHQRVLATRAAAKGRNHPEVARSVRALGQIALGQGRLDEASSYLERAADQQRSTLGESHPELAETLFGLGDVALAKEEFATAEERYRMALEILEEHHGEKDIRTARAWTALARLYEKRQQWSRAEPLLGRAVESVEAVLGPSHLEVADLLEKTATVYLAGGQWDDVLEPLARALAIRIDRLGESHPSVARALKLQGDHSLLLGDVTTARRLYGKADRIVCDHFGLNSPQRFPFRFALAVSLRRLEEFEQSDMHLRTLLDQGPMGVSSQEQLRHADVLYEIGVLQLARGDLGEAEEMLKRALEIRSKHQGDASAGVAACLEAMARVHRSDGRTITAAALAERALAAREGHENQPQGPAIAKLEQASNLELLARLELDQNNLPQAAQHANRALNLRRDVAGEGHPEVASTLHLLGEIALTEGRLEKAEGFFEKALERWEEFFGGSHPQVFQAVTSLAQLYQKQGRLTLAEQYHQRNLVALEGRYGSDHPILSETLLGLGRLCRSQGNAGAAEKHLKRAAEIQTAVFGESDPKVANVLHTLALVYQDQRNFIAAEALLKKARQIREQTSEAETSELAESNLALARLYRSSGKPNEAEPLLKKVLDWRSRRYGDEHPEVASILREMAELYADRNEYLKAQTLVRRALDIYGEALGHRNLELIGPLRQLARLLEASGDIEEAASQRRLARELMGAG